MFQQKAVGADGYSLRVLPSHRGPRFVMRWIRALSGATSGSVAGMSGRNPGFCVNNRPTGCRHRGGKSAPQRSSKVSLSKKHPNSPQRSSLSKAYSAQVRHGNRPRSWKPQLRTTSKLIWNCGWNWSRNLNRNRSLNQSPNPNRSRNRIQHPRGCRSHRGGKRHR